MPAPSAATSTSIGELPKSSPSGYASSHLDAFVWIKPPGESDGASKAIDNDQGKGFDRMCDPTFVSPKLANHLTGATPDAPLAGQWFEAQFKTLVANAYPVIAGGTTPPPTDTTAPSVPTGLTAGTTTSTTVPLSWTASTDNVAVTGYDVYRGTTLVGSSTSTSYTVTGLTAGTAYSFSVRAKDAAGNVSAASSSVSATTSSTPPPTDTTAPSVPSGLAVGTVTGSTVALSWNASTDNVAVTGYDVYRGTTLVGSTTSRTYTVTGLTAGTAYSFSVRAKDAAGNVSAASSSVSATTTSTPPTDTTAPSVPSGLTAGTTTSTSVPLSWTASTDNVAVTGYDVYRGTTLVGSTTSTSYTVTGLTAATAYSFSVRAKDAAGNVSAASASVSATTKSTGGAASCSVTYSANSWNTGFTGSVKVTNTGSTALNGWTLAFSFANGQKVTQGWSADWAQSGSAVTAKNLSWNGALAPGASADIGFNGSHSGTNNAPTSFTLNGATCSVA